MTILFLDRRGDPAAAARRAMWGIGIPPADREDVFKPFFRLDPSPNPDTGGTGLGLTIARDIIRGHGGELTLDDAPGCGLRARIRLPL